ncbi:MAG: aminoglycoside phosphotransferase family protein [Actinomycetota bacterium]
MSPDDLTPPWFSMLFGADIRSVGHEPIGDGLVGMNLRVTLDADRADDDGAAGVPRSVVVKLPSADATSRATGVSLRNYEREVKFYAELADTVDIRVPRCWHAELDETDGGFVLVLEDMAPAAQGDQLTGCTPDAARATVLELAKLHGPRWADPSLDEIEWLSRRSADDVDRLAELWQLVAPGFDATYRRHLTDDQSKLLDAFAPRLGEWLDGRTGPTTVTHGDFRLDNLLFGVPDDPTSPPVTAVDWQTPGQGVAAADLSYFVGAGLLPADRRTHERHLVGTHVDALRAYGVALDPTEAFEAYVRESFAGVVMAVIASQIVGGSERSEAMFTAMATRHLQQALDLDALELVVG